MHPGFVNVIIYCATRNLLGFKRSQPRVISSSPSSAGSPYFKSTPSSHPLTLPYSHPSPSFSPSFSPSASPAQSQTRMLHSSSRHPFNYTSQSHSGLGLALNEGYDSSPNSDSHHITTPSFSSTARLLPDRSRSPLPRRPLTPMSAEGGSERGRSEIEADDDASFLDTSRCSSPSRYTAESLLPPRNPRTAQIPQSSPSRARIPISIPRSLTSATTSSTTTSTTTTTTTSSSSASKTLRSSLAKPQRMPTTSSVGTSGPLSPSSSSAHGYGPMSVRSVAGWEDEEKEGYDKEGFIPIKF